MPDLKVVTNDSPSPLAQLITDYLTHCRARGLSPKTVRDHYGFALEKVFLPWCEREGIRDPADVTSRILDRYSTDLLENGGKRGPLSRESIRTFTSSVNYFLKWARREGEITHEAAAQVPKVPQKVLEILDRDELQRLEDSARNERDKLIVRLFADTGIRVGELLALRLSDLVERDRNHYLRIQGKGGKERLVPIPRIHRRLERYILRGRPGDGTSTRLFLASRRDRRTGDYEPLTKSGIEQLIRNVAELAEIGRRVHPHLLRHSYATWALNKGMNPILLAQLLGHSSLTMIQRTYSHQTPADAHELLARLLAEER